MDREILQINNDCSQIANDLVLHRGKILPSDIRLDYSDGSIKIIDLLIE